jgi:DNA-directed RNA polymerase subunit RPC12/RpoP
LIDTLLNLLFRCAHRRLTRPLTPVNRQDGPHLDTYVVCLDCGKQFEYDLEKMRIGKVIDPLHHTGTASEEVRPVSKAAGP